METIRKRVSEVYGGVLVRFEEESKLQAVCPIVFFVLAKRLVTYMGTSSSPFAFFTVPITNLHSLVIKATAFCEAFENKVRLSLDSLNCEVEPTVAAARVGLLIEADQVCAGPDEIY